MCSNILYIKTTSIISLCQLIKNDRLIKESIEVKIGEKPK